jgi:hypothetical protein
MMKNIIKALLILLVFNSCNKTTKPADVVTPKTHNVLILGNSITYAPANPSIGWAGNWGMAASVADSDYVHLLAARLKKENKNNTVVATNIAEFEFDFDTYNLELNLASYIATKPDIIILRIGEDYTRTADSVLFEKKYVALLNYLGQGNPNVKILAVGSVWPEREISDKVMSKYSNFISLLPLQDNRKNFAFDMYENAGIQSHPSDKGMKAISDLIWAKLQKML